MMKRKFLAVFLPIIGTVAVVGSGFSAWYFGEGGATNDPFKGAFNVDITEAVVDAGGKLVLTTDGDEGKDFRGKKLWLDQAFADTGDENYADSGIIFSSNENLTGVRDDITEASTLDFTYNVKFTEDKANKYTLATADDAGMKLTITFTITLTGGLDDYIQLQTDANVGVVGDIVGSEGSLITAATGHDEYGNTTYTYTYPVSDPGTKTPVGHVDEDPESDYFWNWDFTLSCKTDSGTYKNDLFAWKSGKPKTKDEYDAMLLALKGTELVPVTSQVLFNITAELK